jgi:Kef-type K+ transport system membrane component KefB
MSSRTSEIERDERKNLAYWSTALAPSLCTIFVLLGITLQWPIVAKPLLTVFAVAGLILTPIAIVATLVRLCERSTYDEAKVLLGAVLLANIAVLAFIVWGVTLLPSLS